MKQLIIITTLLISGILIGQTNYEKGMQKAFELWGSNQPTEASNLFERIAKAEPDNWLPAYYAAQINVINSFGERNEDKLSAKLKRAQDLINDATAISKENPEIMVLQALLHTGADDFLPDPVEPFCNDCSKGKRTPVFHKGQPCPAVAVSQRQFRDKGGQKKSWPVCLTRGIFSTCSDVSAGNILRQYCMFHNVS